MGTVQRWSWRPSGPGRGGHYLAGVRRIPRCRRDREPVDRAASLKTAQIPGPRQSRVCSTARGLVLPLLYNKEFLFLGRDPRATPNCERFVPMPEMPRKVGPVRLELPQRAAVALKVRALRRPEAPTPPAGARGERRDPASRTELLRRIESEYREMPGLRLSLPQARRLFALRDDICVRVLTTLADRGVLRRDANGAYVLNGDRP